MLQKAPIRVSREYRVNKEKSKAQLCLVVESDGGRKYTNFVVDAGDGRTSDEGRSISQVDYIAGLGEVSPLLLRDQAFTYLLLTGENIPLSIHKTLTSVAKYLPQYRSLGRIQFGLLQPNEEVLIFEIGAMAPFQETYLFDTISLTGIRAIVINDQIRVRTGKKHHLSKTTDMPCEQLDQLLLNQFRYEVIAARGPSFFRFYLHNQGTPHSLHRDLSTATAAIMDHAQIGQTLTLTNSLGQEISL